MGLQDYYGRSEEYDSRFETPIAWRSGAVSGFVATLATSIFLLAVEPEMFSQTIASMYGMSGALWFGVLVHQINGTLFGIVFAVILADPMLVTITNSLWRTMVAGVIFAIGLAIVGSAFVLPVWLQFLGFGDIPPVPYMTPTLFGWHLLYGLVIGLVFPFLDER